MDFNYWSKLQALENCPSVQYLGKCTQLHPTTGCTCALDSQFAHVRRSLNASRSWMCSVQLSRLTSVCSQWLIEAVVILHTSLRLSLPFCSTYPSNCSRVCLPLSPSRPPPPLCLSSSRAEMQQSLIWLVLPCWKAFSLLARNFILGFFSAFLHRCDMAIPVSLQCLGLITLSAILLQTIAVAVSFMYFNRVLNTVRCVFLSSQPFNQQMTASSWPPHDRVWPIFYWWQVSFNADPPFVFQGLHISDRILCLIGL